MVAYVVLKLWPMERDAGTVQNHLEAIGYFPKVHGGETPMRGAGRLQNLMRGARAKWPAKRKLLVTTEDLDVIYNPVDWPSSDSVTLWCAISLAWFCMLRMGGVLRLRIQKQRPRGRRVKMPDTDE